MKKLPLVEYLQLCPIDKNKASFEEIFKYGICYKDFLKFKNNIWSIIKDNKLDIEELKRFKEEKVIYNQFQSFIKFFKEHIGYEPLKLQKYWAKRALREESFSIIAPTGIGKTTFGIVLSHFLKGKIYYLVPSKILVREIEEKIKKIQSNKKILVIKDNKDKELLKDNFDILITTANFLHRNFESLPKDFDLVFIDDADSLIRQPKNIDKILKLVKFNDEDIEKALKIIDAKRRAKSKQDWLKITNQDLILTKEKKGMIIAASATLTPKTKRIALFRELLGFEIGSSITYLRNLDEVYDEVSRDNLWSKSLFWIKKLGNGGFVFLSDDFSKEDLNNYLKFLEENKISAISYEKFNAKNKEKFLNDEIAIVVGFSNIRNPLTRGIDLPQKIRYALFVGIPKFRIALKSSFSPLHLFLLGLSLREILNDEERNIIERNLNFLKKISFLKEEQILENETLIKKIEPIKKIYDRVLEDKNLLEKIKKHPRISLEIYNGLVYLIVSDPRGYLQASGRTSRLFPLGLTKGLSIILAENIKVLKHLEDKLKVLGYDPEFKKITEVDFEKILKKIDNDREIVKKVLKGEDFVFKDPIETILVIVESPTKARTIANFFGKPSKRIKNKINFYEVSLGNLHLNICATLGHFTDLVHKSGYYGVRKNNSDFIPIFQIFKICSQCERHLDEDELVCPVCKNNEFISKDELVENLQKIATEVDKIYLATDPDSEGEKIAFDLFAYLYSYNQNIFRIELHEITRSEFLRRIKEPRQINFNLVKSQLLRRICDRWLGFKLSEEIQSYFKNLNLSAGRVQTPVLGWILEKEKRIKNKIYFLQIGFNNKNINFYSDKKSIIDEIKKYYKDKNLRIVIKILEKKQEILSPLPSYETGELLKDASSFFRFDTQLTMKLAQDLFEQGLITYHRTDSIYISDFGRNVAKEYLEKKNLVNLLYKRSWGEIGTHEGIRPTRPLDVQDLIEETIISGQRNLTKKHFQLYGLIFNRFLSSQMKPAKVLKTKILIQLFNDKNLLLQKEDEIFLKVLEENHLKYFRNLRIFEIDEGEFMVDKLKIKKVSKEFHYLQGELIEEMKKRGLGRPSTYSIIIETLLERKYIISRSGYLIPTSWGEKIYNYLIKKYPNLISEKFTIKLEKEMDFVAEGKKDYQKILLKIYKDIKI